MVIIREDRMSIKV